MKRWECDYNALTIEKVLGEPIVEIACSGWYQCAYVGLDLKELQEVHEYLGSLIKELEEYK